MNYKQLSLSLVLGLGLGLTAQKKSIDIDAMDQNIRPQDDFFQYCNGNWIKDVEIPASDSYWGSFKELDERNKENIKNIIEELTSNQYAKGSSEQLIKDYYEAFMNMDARNSLGFQPIQDRLDMIDGIKSSKDFYQLVMQFEKWGITHFFGSYIYQDLKDNQNYAMYMSQSGMGLPNKNYYFDEDKESIRGDYKAHVARMLDMIGSKNAKQEAEAAYEVEHFFATHSKTPVEQRNTPAMYNKYAVNQLNKLSTLIPWSNFFTDQGLSNVDTVIIGTPQFFENLDALKSMEIDKIKSYLRWKVINSTASRLSEDFVQADFDFYSTRLRGVKEMKPLNERAINAINSSPLNEALGKLFVERYFPAESKAKVNEMVDNIMAAFRDRLENIDWMSAETKKMAILKLESFGRKLGYPDTWKDFSSLNITNNYFNNVQESIAYSTKEQLDQWGKPVDKTKWGMYPHMVNAYYSPLVNEIAFPAGIMQAPFFDPEAEDAVNYGTMGMVIGHEFTHGFDDSGARFNAEGMMQNWWTEEDQKTFEERTQKVVEEYNHFCPNDSLCVNGALTLGENIADLGGATLGFYAYMKTEDAKSGKKINGFTPEQRFFIALGQLWKIKYRYEALENRINTDVHSPGMYRVNGPLMNMPEFWEAFDVKEGDPMRLSVEKRAKIW